MFVAAIAFQGPAALTVDSKGRIAVPARHRELLAVMNVKQLTITRHPHGALMIFPQPEWERFFDKVQTLTMDGEAWKRVFLGYAMEVEIDGSGRVLIAPELRAAIGLERDAMLIGMGKHLELWDAARYSAHIDAVLQLPLPDSLKSFSY